MNMDRAKDVRIYGQNAVAERALDGMSKRMPPTLLRFFRWQFALQLRACPDGVRKCGVLSVRGSQSLYGAFGVGSIVQYVAVLSRLGDGLQELAFVLADNAVYCGYLSAMFDYLDIPNKKYEGTIPVEKRSFCDGGDYDYEIEFCNVSFKYPETEQYVLKNISLKFPGWKTVCDCGNEWFGQDHVRQAALQAV